MAILNDKFEFEQDGKTYNLYDLPDGFVIKGDINLSRRDLTELPDLSKVIVEGGFYCVYNQLTSLKGAPQEVGGGFYCRFNKLTSLHGAPQEVGGYFDCSSNNLTSIKGAPQKVGGKFDCRHNIFLESLYGISEMADYGKILCSGELNERYGFIEGKAIRYKELLESSTYKTEARIHEILSKRHTKENEAAKEQRQTQIKAGFAAFKKRKQTEERE